MANIRIFPSPPTPFPFSSTLKHAPVSFPSFPPIKNREIQHLIRNWNDNNNRIWWSEESRPLGGDRLLRRRGNGVKCYGMVLERGYQRLVVKLATVRRLIKSEEYNYTTATHEHFLFCYQIVREMLPRLFYDRHWHFTDRHAVVAPTFPNRQFQTFAIEIFMRFNNTVLIDSLRWAVHICMYRWMLP